MNRLTFFILSLLVFGTAPSKEPAIQVWIAQELNGDKPSIETTLRSDGVRLDLEMRIYILDENDKPTPKVVYPIQITGASERSVSFSMSSFSNGETHTENYLLKLVSTASLQDAKMEATLTNLQTKDPETLLFIRQER